MSVVLCASAKGAPGVSLGAWGLVHAWPRDVVGLEVDASGGSWALTHGLTCEPGLMDLAAEQGRISDEAVGRCSMEVGVGKQLICAPRDPVQVRRALDWLSDRLASWPEQIDAVVDAGRVDPALGHPMLGRADAIVVWTHTTPAGLGATASLLAGLDRVIRADAIVRVVTVGETPYPPAEAFEALAEFASSRLSIALGAALPNDARLAAVLASGGRKAGRVCGSWLGRLAAELATTTAYRSPPLVEEPSRLRTVQHVGGVR